MTARVAQGAVLALGVRTDTKVRVAQGAILVLAKEVILDEITSVTPSIGSDSGGTSVTLAGFGFTTATGVLFDGNAATSVSVVDDNTITCVTPAGTAGLVDVTVQRPTTDLTKVDGFEYLSTNPPAFVSVSPDYDTIYGGAALTITGTDLTGTTDVKINGISADNIVIVNSTTITCDAPVSSISGLFDIELFHPLGNVLAEDAFTYVNDTKLTQIPYLVVYKPFPGVRVTQTPYLMVHKPIQGVRLTQTVPLSVWLPTPIPFPEPVVPEVPITEAWEWKTAVNTFESGREQRSALRGRPRVSMSLTFNLDDSEYRDSYERLLKCVSQVFNYPMYVHSTQLTAASSSGTYKLYFDPAKTDLRAGEPIAIFDPHLDKTYMMNIATVDVDGATLIDPLANNVPEYFLVCPAPRFRVNLPAMGMASMSGAINLDMIGAQTRDILRPGQSTTVTKIDGMPLIDHRPLANGDVPQSFSQDVTWIDNDIADPIVRMSWYAPVISSQLSYLVHRSNGFDYWRAIAAELKGRQKPFLVPSFRNDLPVIEQPALGATQFKTDSIQFFTIWRSKAWRYIRIQSNAGVLYRKINEVLANYDSDGQPVSLTIKLDSSIGADAGRNVNMVVSFVNTVRLSDDQITIEHDYADSIITFKTRMVEE